MSHSIEWPYPRLLAKTHRQIQKSLPLDNASSHASQLLHIAAFWHPVNGPYAKASSQSRGDARRSIRPALHILATIAMQLAYFLLAPKCWRALRRQYTVSLKYCRTILVRSETSLKLSVRLRSLAAKFGIFTTRRPFFVCWPINLPDFLI